FPRETTVVLDKQKVIRIPIEYNWRPAKCSSCNVFGHHDNTCPKKKHKRSGQTVWMERDRVEHEPEKEHDDENEESNSNIGKEIVVVEVEPNEPVVSEKEGEDGREKSEEQDFNIDTQPGIPIECEQSEKVNNEKEGEEPREEVRDESIWETPKKKHTFSDQQAQIETLTMVAFRRGLEKKLLNLKAA
ncbi:hypothetical protein FRX31_025690, partial [Thalictrum thalictroides]